MKKPPDHSEVNEPVESPAPHVSPDKSIDALLTLSDQSEKKLESRRAVQWKLKLGLWLGMPTIAYHVLTHANGHELRCGAGFLIVLFTILDFFWTQSNQESHAIDQAFHLYYRHRANKLLDVDDEVEGGRREYPDASKMKKQPLEPRDRMWAILLWLPTLGMTVIYFVAMAAIEGTAHRS